jgi:ZPR1 zinc-finger domain
MERLALAGTPAVDKTVGTTVYQAVDQAVGNGPAAVLNTVLDTVLADGVAAAVTSDDTGNFLKREHARFEDLCPSCRHSGETLMCMVDIPHFKEVRVSAVIVSVHCHTRKIIYLDCRSLAALQLVFDAML